MYWIPLTMTLVAGAMNEDSAREIIEGQRLAVTIDNLQSAAMNSKPDIVEALLVLGVDPNTKGMLPQSIISMATMRSCRETDPLYDPDARDRVLDLLIDAGANVNATEGAGLTTIISVSQRCPGSVVQRLIDAGADIEARSPQGFSALSMAFIVKNYDAARTLVKSGARLSQVSIDKLFSEPPEDPDLAQLVKDATSK